MRRHSQFRGRITSALAMECALVPSSAHTMIRGGVFNGGVRRVFALMIAGLLALLGAMGTAVAADVPPAAPGKAAEPGQRGNIHRHSSQPNVVLLAAGGGWDWDPATRSVGTTALTLATNAAPNAATILATNTLYPNLERLAASGQRWTGAYAGAPSAAASRAALMTGRHSGHGRIRGATPPPLAAEEVTLGEVFRAAGYRTAVIGVWDLGGNNTPGHPMRQGFADWFGFLDSREARDLYPKALWRNAETFDNLLDQRGRLANYAPDWFARFATNYIQVHEDHPFFLYVAHPLPGSATSDEMRDRHRVLWDRFVGAVVRELEQSQIVRETILVVTSTGGVGSGEDPLSEARLRVPLIIRWPGRIAAGQTNDRPVALWDVLPTLAALARVNAPKDLDGISLAPELSGGQEPRPRAGGLYWETAETPPRRALRWDHWKAVERTPGGEIDLFDLKADSSGARSVAADQPERLTEARRRLREAADPAPSARP